MATMNMFFSQLWADEELDALLNTMLMMPFSDEDKNLLKDHIVDLQIMLESEPAKVYFKALEETMEEYDLWDDDVIFWRHLQALIDEYLETKKAKSKTFQ